MRILITGSAGFIGNALAHKLTQDHASQIYGIDNHNDYYDPKLKKARLDRLKHTNNYQHSILDINNQKQLFEIFKIFRPEYVIHLAAQAGVRYSITNPFMYNESNLSGFLNILEGCRHFFVKHLIFASSSSVYGGNTKLPFSESNIADHPVSFYAATKRSNELMAHAYSHLYRIPCTGLRFFTVYGPWGRPDMSLFSFTKKILHNEVIELYNYGQHIRDFTFIDDIIEGICGLINHIPHAQKKGVITPDASLAPWQIYNIGRGAPVQLFDFLSVLEKILDKKANVELLPLQPGDMLNTHADIDKIKDAIGYKPKISFNEGIKAFVTWYRNFYK